MLFLIIMLLLSFEIKSGDKITSIDNILNKNYEKVSSKELSSFFVSIEKNDNLDPIQISTNNNESREEKLDNSYLMRLIQSLYKRDSFRQIENNQIKKEIHEMKDGLVALHYDYKKIANDIGKLEEQYRVLYDYIKLLSEKNKNLESKVEKLDSKLNNAGKAISDLRDTVHKKRKNQFYQNNDESSTKRRKKTDNGKNN